MQRVFLSNYIYGKIETVFVFGITIIPKQKNTNKQTKANKRKRKLMATLSLNVQAIAGLYLQLSPEEQQEFMTIIQGVQNYNNKLETVKEWFKSMGNTITEFTIDGLDVLKIDCIDQERHDNITHRNKYDIYSCQRDVGAENPPNIKNPCHWPEWDNSPYKSKKAKTGFDKNTPFSELVPCLKDTDSHFVYQTSPGASIYIKNITLDMVLNEFEKIKNGGGPPSATFNTCTLWIVL